jgi:hypothetical protein
MEKVVLLTEEQKDQIQGKRFASNSFFNPWQDGYDNWVISIIEQEKCVHPDFEWIKQCPQIDYFHKVITPPPFPGE